jgi:O-antigen ligase
MLGIGAGIMLYSIFFGIRIFKYKLLDYVVLGLCVFRGLLTFSRGGITVPFIAFALIVLLSFVRVRNLESLKKGIYLFIGAVLFYLIFQLANSLTGSALERRYSGETGLTEKTGERDVLSGRDQIFFIDLQIFADNFLIGVGPGMAKPLRYYYGFSNSVSAHNEISRILAEHGLLGLFAVVIYIVLIYSKKKRWRTFPNETFFLLFLWWIGFLNSNHNSFRLGITVLFLGMIVSRTNNNPKYFSLGSKKKYRKEWDEWIGFSQNLRDAAPNNAASEPDRALTTTSTFPR